MASQKFFFFKSDDAENAVSAVETLCTETEGQPDSEVPTHCELIFADNQDTQRQKPQQASMQARAEGLGAWDSSGDSDWNSANGNNGRAAKQAMSKGPSSDELGAEEEIGRAHV